MQTLIFAILGLVSIVVGFLITLILPEIRVIGWVLIGFGVILVGSAAVIDFRRVRGAVSSKRGKFGTGTSVMVIVFVGIIIFVNAISVGVYHQFDLSELSQFTLSSQTKDALAKVKTNIDVLCFFLPTDDAAHTETYALNMLDEYQNYTNDLNIKIIDPDKNPEEAREYNITDSSLYESVVFKTDLGTVLVPPTQIVDPNTGYVYAENNFTSAILQVTGQQEKKVYFVVGDGEASPDSSGTLSDLAASLNTDLLQVETIDLQVATSIPSDCAVLVIAGPTTPMTDSERQIISDYFANDGIGIVMTNPDSPNDVAQILKPWGVNVQSATLIDPSSYVAPNMNIVSVPISRDNYGDYNVYFPGVTAIVAQPTPPSNMEVNAELWTTSNSYLDKNYDPSVTPTFDPTTEIQQSYAVSVLIQPTDIKNADGTDSGVPNAGPYIIAFGDSDFITNTNFYSANNGDLFLKLVSELGVGSQLTQIPNKGLAQRMFILTPEKKNFLNIASVALLPALILIIGVLMWWRRR
jgi:ABC-type uncharacterized transport system involved in gliding motility auxiliary subunit